MLNPAVSIQIDRVPVERRRIDVHVNGDSSAVYEDVRRGLSGQPKSLPPKYFYDPTGSALFERITRLPEYYLTRTEQGIIDLVAEEVMNDVRPEELIELGSGVARKVRSLLDAAPADRLVRYVPVDYDQAVVELAVTTLAESYPSLELHGVVGDFERHLDRLPTRAGRRLMVFFGSTIGNLEPHARSVFLREVRRQLAPGDRFLLGVDLVKDSATLEAAYNDSFGVTREFNRNILRVVNREVGADFRPEAFEHRALYNREAGRIEMHLAPVAPQTVSLKALLMDIRVLPDETIWTESSYKFTKESATAMLEDGGLRLERWYTDSGGLFAMALAGVP